MRKWLSLIAMGLGVAVCTGSLWAQSQTVTGQVVSVQCYLQNKKNVGKAGYVCSLADMKWEGNPPGLLTADGTLYELEGPVVAGNNAKVVPYLGKTVSISGTVTKEYGLLTLKTSDDTIKVADNSMPQ